MVQISVKKIYVCFWLHEIYFKIWMVDTVGKYLFILLKVFKWETIWPNLEIP